MSYVSRFQNPSYLAFFIALPILGIVPSADFVQAQEMTEVLQADRAFADVEALIRGKMEVAGFDGEAKEEIDRLLANREYEMAFEGFFLELIALKRQINLDPDRCRELGRALGLDRHSVYDAEFWQKFENYLANETQKSPPSRS
ncbi:hypothetical protein [Mesorhizobium sp. NPDC059025]|uniref:hypothetical protein n=1 Tax=unclassified Mesorhizobium TaxID=325217 RepID=UPI003682236F